ncbi:MAG: hypothetical protein HVN35_05080 [Methanobacteriaceae archaeon]|nr:hypothetical protein [Methanobacteriaceae archaeon]
MLFQCIWAVLLHRHPDEVVMMESGYEKYYVQHFIFSTYFLLVESSGGMDMDSSPGTAIY